MSTAEPQEPAETPILTLAELERIAIIDALQRCQGNRTHAAKALGISVRTLQRKIKFYGLPALPPSPCRSSQNSSGPL